MVATRVKTRLAIDHQSWYSWVRSPQQTLLLLLLAQSAAAQARFNVNKVQGSRDPTARNTHAAFDCPRSLAFFPRDPEVCSGLYFV